MPSPDPLNATWRAWYVVDRVPAGLTAVPLYEARRTRQHPDGVHHLGTFQSEAEAWRAVDEDWSG